MKNLIGNYTLKSPYHKNKRLNFDIVKHSPHLGEYSYRVLTVEYKGWKAFPVDTFYSESSIIKLIENKIIVKGA